MVLLVLIATYIVISPMVSIHAAGPGSSPIHIVAPNFFIPDFFWPY